MKRIVLLFAIMIMAFSVFAASYRDGVYFAQEDQFPKSGWKYNVTIVVKKRENKGCVMERLQY